MTWRDEAKARCEAATAGPWFWWVNTKNGCNCLATPDRGKLIILDQYAERIRLRQPEGPPVMREIGAYARGVDHNGNPERIDHPDAEFIRHAITDLPRALALLDRAEAVLSKSANQQGVAWWAERDALLRDMGDER